MSRILGHYTAGLILILTFTSINAFSQSNSATPAAPIPVEMINGKNVFIANLTGEDDMFMSVTDQRYYDAFYIAIKNGGRYRLVATPEDADLIFQLRMIKDGVQLTIIDAHSNIALWAISREVSQPSRRSISDAEKNLLSSTVGLAFDLQKLIASAALSPAPGK